MKISIIKIELEELWGFLYINEKVGCNIIISNTINNSDEEKIINEQVEYIRTNRPVKLAKLIEYRGTSEK